MDWDLAIKRNSEVLVEIVADLFAMLGLVGEATVSRLRWQIYRSVLRVLRPAESALRRLIVVAARGVVMMPAVPRSRLLGAVKPRKSGTPRIPSFQLFDPQKRIVFPQRRTSKRPGPRIHIFNARFSYCHSSCRSSHFNGAPHPTKHIRIDVLFIRRFYSVEMIRCEAINRFEKIIILRCVLSA